jgi:hypothetical protein
MRKHCQSIDLGRMIVTPGEMTSRLGSGGPAAGAEDGARAGGTLDSARPGGAAEGARAGGTDDGKPDDSRAGGTDDATRALSVTPDSRGGGGAELVDAHPGWFGTSPAFLSSCIADSKASFRVAGGGGMARQLAIRLRRRLASTSRARVRAEVSPCVRSVMVWSSAPSAMFQEAELGRGTIPSG